MATTTTVAMRLHAVSDGGDMVEAVSDEQNRPANREPEAFEVALRWGDQDSLGHINNVMIARIVEESRVRAFDTWFGAARSDFWTVLARQEIEFVNILHYDVRPVSVQVWVSRIGNSSFDTACRIIDPNGQVAAVSETTLTAFDPGTGRPFPLPDAARAGLSARLGDPVPLRSRR